jgi:hypothetical protein
MVEEALWEVKDTIWAIEYRFEAVYLRTDAEIVGGYFFFLDSEACVLVFK